MVFRLPTHLESFIPPPSAQVAQSRPWRGTIIISGMRMSDRSSNQELRVTAVETDGDNRADLWPPQFFAHIIHERPVLRDVQGWVRRHAPPVCTFMPDRLRDPNANTVNQTTFRSLSRMLFENNTVAIAPWGMDTIPGAGIIIFPAQNSSSLLVGALFLSTQFPDFVVGAPSPRMGLPPTQRHPHYQHPMSPSQGYASSSRHADQPASPDRQFPHPTSPIDQTGGQGQGPYRFIMPRTPYPPQDPTNPSWPAKDENNTDYSTFSGTHNTRYP